MASASRSALSDGQVSATLAAASVVSALSFAGSAFILLCYARFRELRRFSFLLVAVLSLTDIGSQVFNTVAGPSAADIDAMNAGADVTPACLAQAVGASFFELSSVLWTTAIAWTLYLHVFVRMPADQVAARLPTFVAACCGVPLVLALAPLADGSYGPSGAWCWIRADRPAWVFLQFYVPLWGAVAFNAWVYVRTYSLLARTVEASAAAAGGGSGGGGGAEAMGASAGGVPGDETAAKLERVIARLRYYPMILVVVWSFASINRVYEAATGGTAPIFALFFLQKVFSSGQGLLNAFAYGFSDGVRDAVNAELAQCCPRLVAPRADPVAAVIARAGSAEASAAAAHAAAAMRGGIGGGGGGGNGGGGERDRLSGADALADAADDEDVTVRVPAPITDALQSPAPVVVRNPAVDLRRDRVAAMAAAP